MLKIAFKNISQNPIQFFFNICTLSGFLFVFGVLYMFYRNFTLYTSSQPEPLHGLVFVKNTDNTSLDQKKSILEKVPYIAKVEYKNKSEMRNEILNFIQSDIQPLSEQNENIPESLIPDVFEIEVSSKNMDTETLDGIKKSLMNIPSVEDVQIVSSPLLLSHLVKSAKTLLLFLGAAISLALFLMMVYFIKSKINTKNKELHLYAFFGKRLSPYHFGLFIEGFFEVCLGLIMSLGFLWVCQSVVESIFFAHGMRQFGLNQVFFLSPSQIWMMSWIGLSTLLAAFILSFFQRSSTL